MIVLPPPVAPPVCPVCPVRPAVVNIPRRGHAVATTSTVITGTSTTCAPGSGAIASPRTIDTTRTTRSALCAAPHDKEPDRTVSKDDGKKRRVGSPDDRQSQRRTPQSARRHDRTIPPPGPQR